MDSKTRVIICPNLNFILLKSSRIYYNINRKKVINDINSIYNFDYTCYNKVSLGGLTWKKEKVILKFY